MIELSVRLMVLVLATGAAWILTPQDRQLAVQFAAVLLCAYGFLNLLERRDLRTPAVSTVMAIADAAVLSWFLARIGYLGLAGAIVALPLLLSSRKWPAHAGFAAPLVAATIPVMANTAAPVNLKLILGHTAGALLLSLIPTISWKRKEEQVEVPDVPIPAPAVSEVPTLAVIRQIAADHAEDVEAVIQTEPDVIELRENYRRLREHAQELEERARRERLAMRLLDLDAEPGDTPFVALSNVIRDYTSARGATLYTCLQRPGALTVVASSGDVPFRVRSERIVLSDFRSDVRLRAHAVAHLRDPEDDSPTCAVLLKHRGSLVGLVWLSGDHDEQLNLARDRAEDAAELLARAVVQIATNQALKERASQLELLYAVAGTAEGAETPRTLMMRVAREMFDQFQTDHLGLSVLDNGQPLHIVTEGASLRILEALRAENATGLAAWESLGFTDIFVEDTHTDSRIPVDEAVKRRIGSALLAPIRVGNELYGVLTAATHRKGGISPDQAESLKLAALEIGLAIERLEGCAARPSGNSVASEFQAAALHGHGALVILEPIRKKEVISVGGPAVLERALREYCLRLRSSLPYGGLMHRRTEDVLIFVPNLTESDAQLWANEAVTLAALMQVPIAGVPGISVLSLQARVSEIGADLPKSSVEITSSVGGPA